MSLFKVRMVTPKAFALKDYILKVMDQENWMPGLKDVDSFLACDPTGVFVGELNEKPMCFVSILKYTDSYCSSGSFYVEKEYRSSGYGEKLCTHVLKRMSPTYNISGYSLVSAVGFYRKFGMQPFWLTPFFELDLPRVYPILDSVSSHAKYQMCSVNEVDFQDLTKYDTSVFGYPRDNFLHQWLHVPGSHARVAISHEGKIVGYAASRPTFNRQQGYRLGPLYANSMGIAEGLMKAIFKDILEEGSSAPSSVYVECPVGINYDAKILMETLKAKVCYDSVYVARKIPNGRFNNWFAITSPTIG